MKVLINCLVKANKATFTDPNACMLDVTEKIYNLLGLIIRLKSKSPNNKISRRKGKQ
jgi:hypothetical protein